MGQLKKEKAQVVTSERSIDTVSSMVPKETSSRVQQCFFLAQAMRLFSAFVYMKTCSVTATTKFILMMN